MQSKILIDRFVSFSQGRPRRVRSTVPRIRQTASSQPWRREWSRESGKSQRSSSWSGESFLAYPPPFFLVSFFCRSIVDSWRGNPRRSVDNAFREETVDRLRSISLDLRSVAIACLRGRFFLFEAQKQKKERIRVQSLTAAYTPSKLKLFVENCNFKRRFEKVKLQDLQTFSFVSHSSRTKLEIKMIGIILVLLPLIKFYITRKIDKSRR